MNVRAQAALILQRVTQQRLSLSAVLDQQPPLPPADQALVRELCFGVLRWYLQLEAISQQLLNTPLKKRDHDIQCLLLSGLYQLYHLQTPDYAAVNETVAAAKQLKKNWASGLLNKVLRRAIAEKNQLKLVPGDAALQYAHPAWLVSKIQSTYPNQWQDILNANNDRPPLFLRINHQRITREDFLTRCQSAAIDARPFEACASAVWLPERLPVSQIPGFQEGLCSVQDVSGQLVLALLDCKPHQRVLDACAAPGSKTSHILEQRQDLDCLVAVDKDATRLVRIKDNIQRLQLGHQNVQLKLADASHTDQWWDGKPFDRILLDAPCSGTGVIRRHPDIKLLKRQADIAQLKHEQQKLLHRLWPLLHEGGKLVYSTCSILAEENEHVIGAFCKSHHDAKVQPIPYALGITQPHGHQLIPTPHGPDGFYMSCLQKAATNRKGASL